MRIILFIYFLSFTSLYGQNLISYELVSSLTASQANSQLGGDGTFDQDIYKVLYYTEHLGEVQDTASGLVCMPIALGRTFPIAVYMHGTVDSREAVPSRLDGYEIGAILASEGYIGVMPDFIGLGDSKGLHPYIHSDTESSSGADLILASYELANQIGVVPNEQIFVTGYSQGGHAGAALHRDIEAGRFSNLNTVTAASHMSGPYSVSKEMPEFTLGDENYFFGAYLAWVTLSMQATYPDLLSDFTIADIFRDIYVNDIERFKNEEIGLIFLNIRLATLLQANNGGTIQPKNMLQPEILDAILNDPSHPVSQALARNDLLDWVPQAPTRLMYCEGDDQVGYLNSILAEETMNANGAPDLLAVNHGNLTHGGCVNPAVEATIEFFKQYQEVGFYLNTTDLDSQCQLNFVNYNNRLELQKGEYCEANRYTYSIIDLHGRVHMQGDLSTDTSIINIEALSQGLFVISTLASNGEAATYKFSKL